MARRVTLVRLLIIGLLGVSIYLGYQIYSSYQLVGQVQSAHTVITKGAEKNAIIVVEFLDYNCPYCRQIHPVVTELLELRPDIRYIARPIPAISNTSEKATRYALAAGNQGKFTEFHNAFLRHKGVISTSFVRQTAKQFDVDFDRLFYDARSDEISRLMQDNIHAAKAAGIRATPTFMIGKTVYVPESTVPKVQDFLSLILKEEQS